MTPYVKHLSTNLKGNRSYELGPKTLIIGDCASGKTAIPQALEFALSGSVSDIAGRSLVAESALLATLGPVEGLQATVTLSNGLELNASIIPNGKGGFTKKTPGSVDTNLFPLRQVREALTGSSEKAQRFLLNAASVDVSSNQIVESFPEDLRSYYAAIAHGSTPMAQLLAARTEAGERHRDAKKSAEGAMKVIEALGAGRVLPGPQEIQQAQARLDELREQHAQNQRALANRPDINILREYARNLRTTCEAAAQRAQFIQKRAAELQGPNDADRKRAETGVLLDAAQKLHVRHAKGDTDNCMVCETHVGKDKLFSLASNFDSNYKKWFLQGEARRSELQERLDLEQEYRDIEIKYRSSVSMIESTENTIKQWEDTPAPVLGAETTLAKDLIDAENNLGLLRATAESWNSARRARDEAADFVIKANAWKAVGEACDEVIQDLVSSSLSTFVHRVQQFLPNTDVFQIELEPFRFGLRRNNVLHVALSGAEWVRVLCAIGAALVKPGQLSILFPEERAFDPQTLTQTLLALTQSDGQVVLTSTIEPSSVPDGWTVIRLDSEDVAAIPEKVPVVTKLRKKAARIGKEEKELLAQWGWTDRQVRDMLPEVRARVLAEQLENTGYVVLPDGDLHAIPSGTVTNGVH